MDAQYAITKDPEVAARTGELLDRLGSDLTALDFARLAMACADQAMLPTADQQKLAALIENHFGHEVLW
jgi:hypothetical protein